jgi:hypothetical protein
LPGGVDEALGRGVQPRLYGQGAPSKLSSKWHETGPIDPVKAILIMNEQE